MRPDRLTHGDQFRNRDQSTMIRQTAAEKASLYALMDYYGLRSFSAVVAFMAAEQLRTHAIAPLALADYEARKAPP